MNLEGLLHIDKNTTMVLTLRKIIATPPHPVSEIISIIIIIAPEYCSF
jgi:hypothetical protein